MGITDNVLFTFAIIIFTGIVMIIVSHHLNIPAIVFLLAGGIIIGPEVLKIVDPGVFGDNFRTIVSLCVAVILFEGGLTLNPEGYKTAPKIIIKLLTIGVLITWLGSTILIYFIFQYSFTFSLLAGSLIIVTGPTVISPILKRLNVRNKIKHILHWEAILIDPIGVFIAVLAFEWLYTDHSISTHLYNFGFRILLGVGLGFIGGLLSYWLLKKKLIHDEQANIFVLTIAIMLFSVSEIIVHESGILTVIVAGFVLGWKKPAKLEGIIGFKSELTEISIAVLFLLLASNLNVENMLNQDWRIVLLIGLVIFVIRPLNIFISSFKSSITVRERVFLSWISPRGIVAAAMASLFAIELASQGNENALFLETFTYGVIIVTVIFQGASAKKVSLLLKINEKKCSGWIIVGINTFSKRISDFITETTGQKCIFIDQNPDLIETAFKEGYVAVQGDALYPDDFQQHLFSGVNNILALTDNRVLNQKVCKKWLVAFQFDNSFYWSCPSTEDCDDLKEKAVWSSLPKPSEIAFNIEQNKTKISKKDFNDVEDENIDDILLYSVNNICLPLLNDKQESVKTEVLIISEGNLQSSTG